jgi:hypothetical protein
MDASEAVGEPWGRRLWLAVALTAAIAAALQSYGISRWPMADDEVPSLVEMGLSEVDPQAFSVPVNQVGRLPRALPVWYRSQRFAIGLLPKSEVSYRLPSVLWAVLTVALAFVLAARWKGLWFGCALALLMCGSQLFIYIAQLDRFYSLPLLLLSLTFVTLWFGRRWVALPLVVVLTVLTVLSHNVTIAVFGLAFVASLATFILGITQTELVLRSALAFAVSAAVYLGYLKPIVTGWNSTGNPTPVLVSFAAHAGIPLLALAGFGALLGTFRRQGGDRMFWWVLMFIGGFCAFQLAPISWNPRYFLFFLPPLWILGAHAVDFIARRIGRGWAGAAWYGCVALLLAPSLLSHYQDGSRHDYRQAAATIVAADTTGAPVLSDDAETISYYLPAAIRHNLFVRTKITHLPESEFFLVTRSNAWLPLPQIPDRRMDLLAEIYKRRFDQFSHILRVYRVAARGQ